MATRKNDSNSSANGIQNNHSDGGTAPAIRRRNSAASLSAGRQRRNSAQVAALTTWTTTFLFKTMPIPDISDDDKMAHIGRMTVLRKARREAGQKLRDKLVPMLNNLEGAGGNGWELAGVVELVEEINALTAKMDEIN